MTPTHILTALLWTGLLAVILGGLALMVRSNWTRIEEALRGK
ncbi:MAG: hypothetical protein WKF79_00465 [Nocardioides sp.]